MARVLTEWHGTRVIKCQSTRARTSRMSNCYGMHVDPVDQPNLFIKATATVATAQAAAR